MEKISRESCCKHLVSETHIQPVVVNVGCTQNSSEPQDNCVFVENTQLRHTHNYSQFDFDDTSLL